MYSPSLFSKYSLSKPFIIHSLPLQHRPIHPLTIHQSSNSISFTHTIFRFSCVCAALASVQHLHHPILIWLSLSFLSLINQSHSSTHLPLLFLYLDYKLLYHSLSHSVQVSLWFIEVYLSLYNSSLHLDSNLPIVTYLSCITCAL